MSNDQPLHQAHADQAEFVAIKQAITRVDAEAEATIAGEERAALALRLSYTLPAAPASQR